MTPFAIAINDYVAQIKTSAEAAPVRQASLKEFNSAIDAYLAQNGGSSFREIDDTSALTGAGADWDISERSQLWADVAQVEADYKVDGREG